MSRQLFTIGHSNHTIGKFIGLLQQHGVTVVGDVRSHPYSRYFPQFNKSELQKALTNAGIRYLFLGRELGGKANESGCFDLTGKSLSDSLVGTSEFDRGIKRLLQDCQTDTIALMCAEKDPITCHRTILVCQHLRNTDLTIEHILGDGELESHSHLEERLVEAYGLQQLQELEARSLSDPPPEADTLPSSQIRSAKKPKSQ